MTANISEYRKAQRKLSYDLYKNNKVFKKSRALIIKGDSLILIAYKQKGKQRYIIPGGGVENNETPLQAAVREAREEANIIVKPKRYIGKQYYSVNMKHGDTIYKSNRVCYYYLCEFVKYFTNTSLGLDGEFGKKMKAEVVEVPISQLKNIPHRDLNSISKTIYERIINKLTPVDSKQKIPPMRANLK